MKQDMVGVARRVIKEGRFYTDTVLHESASSGLWSELRVGYRLGQAKVEMGAGGTVWLQGAESPELLMGRPVWRIYDSQFWYGYKDDGVQARKAIKRLLNAKYDEVHNRELAVGWASQFIRQYPGQSLSFYEGLVALRIRSSKRLRELVMAEIMATVF